MTQAEIQKALELCKRLGIKVHKERKAKTTSKARHMYKSLRKTDISISFTPMIPEYKRKISVKQQRRLVHLRQS
jgi:D-arabinose 1-dehydrogenase-like Zn-dependent alcohol dehydrogenase